MTLKKTFHTRSRREFGLLYMNLFQGVESKFFTNPDYVPVMAMNGAHGKSFAAEVAMKHILDGYDPLQTIEGTEQRHMFLEQFICDAAVQMLHVHGTTAGDIPVTLGFNSWPETLQHGEELQQVRMGQHPDEMVGVRHAFAEACRKHSNQDHGGMVFVSHLRHAKSGVWLSAELSGDGWDKIHEIEIIAPELVQSDVFQAQWAQQMDCA